jgi:hypothetical protein
MPGGKYIYMLHLEELTTIQAPIERCFDLARSVEVHLAGNEHWGEQAVATMGYIRFDWIGAAGHLAR